MIGAELVETMLQDGVEISEEEQVKVSQDLEREVADGKVHIIMKGEQPIGFMTYIEDGKEIYVDYLFIYKAFRNKCNLLYLRNILREKYDSFRGKRRKYNRYSFVK